LPTPTLAGADGDDVLDAWNRLTAAFGANGFAHHRAHVHVDRRNPWNLHDRCARLIAHLILHRTGRRGQFDRERHASAFDRQILDEAEADDVAVEIRVADHLERVEHGGLLQSHDQSLAAFW
jgi:hypothetical protein